ncbi:MAG: hypothetical protein ACXWKP_30190 [Bradyrhizobium sp.]
MEAIDEIGAEEIWKGPVDRILARLAATAAGLAAAGDKRNLFNGKSRLRKGGSCPRGEDRENEGH